MNRNIKNVDTIKLINFLPVVDGIILKVLPHVVDILGCFKNSVI